MTDKNNSTKAERKYFIIIATLLPFLILIASGIILLLYHTGKPETEYTLSLAKNIWLTVHKTATVFSVLLITIHLIQHASWFKKVLSGKLKSKNKEMNLTLLALFLFAMITGVSSWLLVSDEKASYALLGVHNKFGLLLIILFLIHLKNYFRWLFTMTKKRINK